MSTHLNTWERTLLDRAIEAINSPIIAHHLKADPCILESAYEHCATITKAGSHTFYLAANLLAPEKRRAVYALYAFCRITDDLVDETSHTVASREAFAQWRHSLTQHPHSSNSVQVAWADAQTRYSIPRGYADQLVEGIARDFDEQRYHTFAELTEYCYGVASTVGLMVMYIIGFQGADALPYAIKLGVALQLTNILRDVGEDWRAGKLYLPLKELEQFGLTTDDIEAGRIDERWRAFMRFQIERIHKLYEESKHGLAFLAPEGRFAIAAASTLYRAILKDIEAHDYDVFNRRAHIGLLGKLKRLPAIWWASKHVALPD